jgi:hypothetical protein
VGFQRQNSLTAILGKAAVTASGVLGSLGVDKKKIFSSFVCDINRKGRGRVAAQNKRGRKALLLH